MAFGGCTNHKQMQAYLLHEKNRNFLLISDPLKAAYPLKNILVIMFLLIFSSGAWLSIPPSPHLHIRHLRIPDYKLPPWAHQWPTNLPTLPRGTHVKILQNPGKRFNKIKRMIVFSHHQHQPKIWFKHCRNCNSVYSLTFQSYFFSWFEVNCSTKLFHKFGWGCDTWGKFHGSCRCYQTWGEVARLEERFRVFLQRLQDFNRGCEILGEVARL